MKISNLINVVKDYKNNTLRANAQMTKQAKADMKLLDLLVNDMDLLVSNGYDLEIDLHTSDIDNIGVIAQNIGYALALMYDNKNVESLVRDNHTNAKFNKVACIKSYVTSKPSAVSKNAPKYTYIYYVRATFHGLVRFESAKYIGARIVNADIPNGTIVKVF